MSSIVLFFLLCSSCSTSVGQLVATLWPMLHVLATGPTREVATPQPHHLHSGACTSRHFSAPSQAMPTGAVGRVPR
ncbi:hypothetical protein DFH09DRAFT_1150118 [Mycena vulgaris]|nr:hypothetical protein DFH09DRAFT_1150118 [Mycena vulgaris]